ncbi:hypothetical protein ACE1B6_24125 [Aerosakkonemataceae cyanobacterium BLCC-F154]|uniref:Uncharacterized protein n=1 Tax=Floridaenema fluviatile BLCC-F154 TaxID=3153640 RepID=A0ABV4YHP1_9CYAN
MAIDNLLLHQYLNLHSIKAINWQGKPKTPFNFICGFFYPLWKDEEIPDDTNTEEFYLTEDEWEEVDMLLGDEEDDLEDIDPDLDIW